MSVKVKMNSAGAQALLKSGPIAADMLRRAQAVANRANSQLDTLDGGVFVADVITGKTRARAAVKAQGPYPRAHNARHNTLLKSLGAGQ